MTYQDYGQIVFIGFFLLILLSVWKVDYDEWRDRRKRERKQERERELRWRELGFPSDD